MRKTAAIIVLPLFAVLASTAGAAPDRDTLVAAWESHIRSLPGTANLEAVADGVYRFRDEDLPYEGELKINGVLVRPADSITVETEFTHTGMLDFQLTDLPVERMSSQVYYYWHADRQSLYYSSARQGWVGPAEYQASIAQAYSGGDYLGPMWFMLNYGIWILLIGLVLFVFSIASRQARKTRSLMDENAAINQGARENLDRAAGLQDELLAIARENRDLQAHNNDLLRKMLEALNR